MVYDGHIFDLNRGAVKTENEAQTYVYNERISWISSNFSANGKYNIFQCNIYKQGKNGSK